MAHQLIGGIGGDEAAANGVSEDETQRRPPRVDRVASVPGGELLAVPRDKIVRSDGTDQALPKRRQAMQAQARFIAVIGALRELVYLDAVLLVEQPFARDFGQLERASRESDGLPADLDGKFVSASTRFHQTDVAQRLPASLPLAGRGGARVVGISGPVQAAFDSDLLRFRRHDALEVARDGLRARGNVPEGGVEFRAMKELALTAVRGDSTLRDPLAEGALRTRV